MVKLRTARVVRYPKKDRKGRDIVPAKSILFEVEQKGENRVPQEDFCMLVRVVRVFDGLDLEWQRGFNTWDY